jgi:aminoglycoside phosphotransferase (APT) family kinase protein
MSTASAKPLVTECDPEIRAFLIKSGLIAAKAKPAMTPLTGGVASDIWLVEAKPKRFVVKRALARLRVAQEWEVPVSRNASEVGWMREVARTVPGAVPEILAHDAVTGAFAMTYLPPETHRVWKSALLAGVVDKALAGAVGSAMGAIHAATAGSAMLAARFGDETVFHAVRLEPYLEATALKHPDLADALIFLSRDTLAHQAALVHGDISPKNILAGPDGPVFLDAECAWYGDPAFDLAFCLNHLLLKCVVAPDAAGELLGAFDALFVEYRGKVDWEAPEEVEARASHLLPALMLARIDGKSPVEYITKAADQDLVRRFARGFVLEKPAQLGQVRGAWAKEFGV